MFFYRALFLFALPLVLAANGAEGEDGKKFAADATNNEENCLAANYPTCYNQILEFIKLGDEAINLSDEKKAILVIGLNRVGKSTFTQFVANMTNPLSVSCDGANCNMVDESGNGGSGSSSHPRTFVPNTVEDLDTNGVTTPFYDMTGFDDEFESNVTTEIARAFFFNKVVQHIKEVKIVAVAKHSGFNFRETNTFHHLMRSLIKLTKNPNKFKNSVVLISTKSKFFYEDVAHFYSVQSYLHSFNESLHLNESPFPESEEIRRAQGWVERFLDVDPTIPQKIEIFREPDAKLNRKSIRDIKVYQEDLGRIKNLIWNDTVFTKLAPGDVKLELSEDAEKFLAKAVQEQSNAVKNGLNKFSSRAISYLQVLVESIEANSNSEDQKRLLNYLDNLRTLEFSRCNSDAKSSPRSCIDEINSKLSSLAEDMKDATFSEIENNIKFLQFVFDVSSTPKPYNMIEWVTEIDTIEQELIKFIQALVETIAEAVVTEFERFSLAIHDYFEESFERLTRQPYPDNLSVLNRTINELLHPNYPSCQTTSPKGPSACLAEIVKTWKTTIGVTNSSVEANLNSPVELLHFAFHKLDIGTNVEKWADSFLRLKYKLLGTLELKTTFQRIMNKIFQQVTQTGTEIAADIKTSMLNHTHIQPAINFLKPKVTEIETLGRNINVYSPHGPFAGFLNIITTSYKKLQVKPSSIVVRTDVVYLAERLRTFQHFEQNQLWNVFYTNNFVNPFSTELIVKEFLIELFKDLEGISVQVDEVGGLHTWRASNSIVDQRNFDAFWTKFKAAGLASLNKFNLHQSKIKSHITGNVYSKNWLNTLLDYTIKRTVAGCPTATSSQVIFERKYMTLSYVINCLRTYTTTPLKIIALAENTFFMNADLNGPSFLSRKTKFFVISRNIDWTKKTGSVNLSGKNGAAPSPLKQTSAGGTGASGAAGMDGSDFIGVYQLEKGTHSSFSMRGGNGGNGQGGGDGRNSADTGVPSLSTSSSIIAESQCAAWSGGRVQVRIHPNTCNSPSGGDCHAGNSGVGVTICGTKPGVPGNGGQGGNGGTRGRGGWKVWLKVSASQPTLTTGLDGTAGSRGNNGVAGQYGKWGAMRATIDDVSKPGGKRCKLLSWYSTTCHQSPRSLKAAIIDEPLLKSSISQTNNYTLDAYPEQSLMATYSLAEFKTVVRQFVTSAERSLNAFNGGEMSTFLGYVTRNANLN